MESQHHLSTRKLVDSALEQELLETLIDRVKPPVVTGGGLHFLLFTPFRYPPLRHGSRFGTRRERGIWYGSETRETMFAEVAYYRLVFLEGTRADLGALTTQLDVFRVSARSPRAVDFTAPAFSSQATQRSISSPSHYADTQALGRAMRDAGVELFRYPSARDPGGGSNVGAFTPTVFGKAKPRDLEPWHCIATKELVEVVKRDYFGRAVHSFPRDLFLVDGSLPAPAL